MGKALALQVRAPTAHASDPQNSREKPVTVEHACHPVVGELSGR